MTISGTKGRRRCIKILILMTSEFHLRCIFHACIMCVGQVWWGLQLGTIRGSECRSRKVAVITCSCVLFQPKSLKFVVVFYHSVSSKCGCEM